MTTKSSLNIRVKPRIKEWIDSTARKEDRSRSYIVERYLDRMYEEASEHSARDRKLEEVAA